MTPIRYAGNEANANRLLDYIQTHNPDLYRVIMRELAGDGLGADDAGSVSIFDKISSIAQTYLQTQQQRDIIKMQTERAKAGLAPLDVTGYSAPAIKVDFDASNLRSGFVETFKPFLPFVAVGALIFFNMKRSRK